MAEQAVSGIYEIVNLVTGKRYVGSARNLRTRKIDHFKLLRRGTHHSRHLQASFNKYGGDRFEFRVIEYVRDQADLVVREQHYFDTLGPEYNIARVAGSCLGVRHSDEAKAKMSAFHKGKKLSPEHIEKIVARQKGSKWSEQTRAKMAEAFLRRSADPEYRKFLEATGERLADNPQRITRLREVLTGRPSPLKGTQRAPDAVEKTAASHRGRKRSAETCAKIAEKARGRKLPPRSAEYRAKISAAHKGRPKSPEHIAALQAGRAARVYTDEQRTRTSEAVKLAYDEGRRSRERPPEYRDKIAATLQEQSKSPEVRERLRAQASAAWRDRSPEERRQHMEMVRAAKGKAAAAS
jgi:group I intron endonuclease